MGLFTRIFGKRKDGECRWWQHKYGEDIWRTYSQGTGRFIGDQEITIKRKYYKSICLKCGHEFISDSTFA